MSELNSSIESFNNDYLNDPDFLLEDVELENRDEDYFDWLDQNENISNSRGTRGKKTRLEYKYGM